MKHFLITIQVVLVTAVAVCAVRAADLVFVGGHIYTMNPRQPQVEAVAVTGDRIVFTGARDGALARRGPDTRVIDLDGLTALPGLVDAHAHVSALGRMRRELNLNGTSSSEEIRAMVVEHQKDFTAGAWVQGRGWDQNDWDDKAFPTWRELFGTEANPVCLRRVDGHAVWVNRTALDIAGVGRETKDPEGGRIERDADGEPTGVLVDRARELVFARIPNPSTEERMRRVRIALAECARLGLTGVHDAGIGEEDLHIYRTLLDRGELTLRVYAMLDSDSTRFVRRQVALGAWSDPQHLLTVRAIKVYVDGALGSRGALLLEPYSDEPGHRGLLQNPRRSIEEWAELAAASGFQLCAHAIGDGGNRLILDVYEAALRAHPSGDHRFRVEHAQVLALDDIPRFAEMGVIASVQPTHATSDMYWAEERVGPERIRGAYAWRRLLESGAVISCGSDFPVESANPLWGIFAAVTRRDHEGWPAGGWYPDERMTVGEAIAGFTRNAAFASFEENLKGTIEVGKLADLTIIDRDPFEVAPREILETSVRYTVVGGRLVYEGRK